MKNAAGLSRKPSTKRTSVAPKKRAVWLKKKGAAAKRLRVAMSRRWRTMRKIALRVAVVTAAIVVTVAATGILVSAVDRAAPRRAPAPARLRVVRAALFACGQMLARVVLAVRVRVVRAATVRALVLLAGIVALRVRVGLRAVRAAARARLRLWIPMN